MLICKICGMKVNENNIEINKEAFINRDVFHCPFCGVKEEYLEEEGRPLWEKEIILSEEETKIIDHAMKLEIFNGDFYKIASDMSKDKRIKKIFIGLSNIEYTHANIHRKILGKAELPKLSFMDYSKYETEYKLIEQANIREHHAVSYYEKYEKKIKNEKVVEILRALGKVEIEHILLTQEIIQ